MEINYELSQDGLTIETSPRGVLDLERTIDYFDRLACDDRINANAVEIVDPGQVSAFLISNYESEQITRRYQKPKVLKRIMATVFLSETPLAYGIKDKSPVPCDLASIFVRNTVGIRNQQNVADVS